MTVPYGRTHASEFRFTTATNALGNVMMASDLDSTSVNHDTLIDVVAPTINLTGAVGIQGDLTADNFIARQSVVAPKLVGQDVEGTKMLSLEADNVNMSPAGTLWVDDLRTTGETTEMAISAAKINISGPVDITSGDLTVPRVEVATEVVAPLITGAVAAGSGLPELILAADTVIVPTGGTIQANSFTTADPLNEDMVLYARNFVLNGNVEVKGTLDTINTEILTVRDKEIKLGFIDANGDGIDDETTDTLRDGAGIVLPGAPENLPVGVDAANYQHALRWKRNEGDFAVGGAPFAPHQKPMWSFSGGGIAIDAPYGDNLMGQWFMAPYFDAATDTASLGMYFKRDGAAAQLIQNFVAAPVA
jgi:hypothetical protein